MEPYTGTGTFNGHQFHFATTYDSSHIVFRASVSTDNPVQVYDPYKNPPTSSSSSSSHQYQIDKLSSLERLKYNKQLLNLSYMRDYMIATKRPWLAMFPRPRPIHYMWSTNFFGQTHEIKTKELHFTSLPPSLDKISSKLSKEEVVSNNRNINGLNLSDHRRKLQSSSPLGGKFDDTFLTLQMIAVSCAPRIFEIPNFLSDVEVNHLLSLAKNVNMTQSTVSAASRSLDKDDTDRRGSDDDGNFQEDISTRSSKNGWIGRETSPIVDAIYRRAADVLRIDESLLRHRYENDDDDEGGNSKKRSIVERSSMAEPLQMVHYQVNQHYTAHHDFTFPPSQNAYQPTRFATLLLYLNDDMEGGETIFPKAMSAHSSNGIQITPEAGKAVLFYNVLPDGNMDDLSQHAAAPVKRGEKWMANLWVWDPVIN